MEIAVKVSRRKGLREVCEKLGIPYQTLVNQKYRKKYPSLENTVRLASEQGCTLDWLIMGVGSDRSVV